ncbi:hypothetical protein [Paenibacillus massiliensis]|uniref:hypothetical protein n=1 Tax=Paenibacillus massiliensis TaxID=225917 RepID=UPI00048A684B|nr:hypothetical protein [Paenibacillus massiliensis]
MKTLTINVPEGETCKVSTDKIGYEIEGPAVVAIMEGVAATETATRGCMGSVDGKLTYYPS